MFARLWWKEMRQFLPIWVLLVVFAAAAQVLAIRFEMDHVRSGALGLFAAWWAGLYAVAVGSAAFAGEREAGTLDLLDHLPVGRRLLWGGKASFALASTIGLALVLLAMAAVSTERWVNKEVPPGWVAAGVAALLLEAVAWGLFWSSRSKSAMIAAVLTIASLGLAAPLIAAAVSFALEAAGLHMRRPSTYQADGFVDLIPWRLGVSALAVAASALVMTRPPRRFSGSTPAPRVRRVRLRWPWEVERSVAWEDRPERLRRPVLPEVRVLAWQALREGLRTWWVLALLAVAVPLALTPPRVGLNEPGFAAIGLVCLFVGLAAGVSVFNVENRGGTQRFLAHHGARPGLVWGAKLAVWLIGLAVILTVMYFLAPYALSPRLSREVVYLVTAFTTVTLIAFGVGLVCGMVFRRGITAWVVGVLVQVLLVVAAMAYLGPDISSVRSVIVGILALVVVSWSWRRDWMFQRPAPGCYVRLGLWVTAMIVVTSGAHVADRLWGVPSSASLGIPAGWNAHVADADNAAPLYLRAGTRMRHSFPADPRTPGWLDRPGTPTFRARTRLLEEERDALALTREASKRPQCRFEDPAQLRTYSPIRSARFLELARLVEADAMVRGEQGDLAGAWDDLMVLFRMSRHIAGGPHGYEASASLSIEAAALGMALEWSNAPGQTAARLRAARADYEGLHVQSVAPEFVRAQAAIVEQTLSRPAEELRDGLFGPLPRGASIIQAPFINAMLRPWEVTRARNACRLVLADALVQATREPWQRDFIQPGTEMLVKGGHRGDPSPDPVPPGTIIGPSNRGLAYRLPPGSLAKPVLVDAIESTSLARQLLPDVASYLAQDGLNEVGRRVLPYYLHVRAWQVEHNGRFPDPPGEAGPETWPVDPYSGGLFCARAVGADSISVRPLGEVFDRIAGSHDQFVLMTRRPVIYSVGPDHHDDQAEQSFPGHPTADGRGDLIFPFPPQAP